MKPLLLVAALLAATSASPAPRKIGFYGAAPRIVNGQDAAPGQFPYQLSFQWRLFGRSWQHVCGASVITPTWVVTAGHCILGVPTFGSFRIAAGVNNLADAASQGQVIAVSRTVVHPGYQGDVGPDDIAVAELASPLTFNDLVRPIRLAPGGGVASGLAVLSGWGATESEDAPQVLKQVNVQILGVEECHAWVEGVLGTEDTNPLHKDANICTNGANGISACSGDSGGPLAIDGVLWGIVSWGFIPCGQGNAPSMYVNVANYADFIQSNVGNIYV